MSATPKKPTLQPLENVEVVETESQCVKAMERIMNDLAKWHIVGLYCEWNHQLRRGAPGQKMGNVLIVSICTYFGYCALFRIDKLGAMPKSLKDLLESEEFGKTSVKSEIIAKHLLTDYGVYLQRFGDINEAICHDRTFSNPATLEVLKLSVDRNQNDFNHTKWSTEKLSSLCTKVAAEHAYRCLELYEKFDINCFTDLSSSPRYTREMTQLCSSLGLLDLLKK